MLSEDLHIDLARGCDFYRSSFPAVSVQAPKVEKRTFLPAVFTQSICSSPTRYLLHGFHRWLLWSALLVLEEPYELLTLQPVVNRLNLYIIYTPEDERIEPENDGLESMFFRTSRGVLCIVRFQPLIFGPGGNKNNSSKYTLED